MADDHDLLNMGKIRAWFVFRCSEPFAVPFSVFYQHLSKAKRRGETSFDIRVAENERVRVAFSFSRDDPVVRFKSATFLFKANPARKSAKLNVGVVVHCGFASRCLVTDADSGFVQWMGPFVVRKEGNRYVKTYPENLKGTDEDNQSMEVFLRGIVDEKQVHINGSGVLKRNEHGFDASQDLKIGGVYYFCNDDPDPHVDAYGVRHDEVDFPNFVKDSHSTKTYALFPNTILSNPYMMKCCIQMEKFYTDYTSKKLYADVPSGVESGDIVERTQKGIPTAKAHLDAVKLMLMRGGLAYFVSDFCLYAFGLGETLTAHLTSWMFDESVLRAVSAHDNFVTAAFRNLVNLAPLMNDTADSRPMIRKRLRQVMMNATSPGDLAKSVTSLAVSLAAEGNAMSSAAPTFFDVIKNPSTPTTSAAPTFFDVINNPTTLDAVNAPSRNMTETVARNTATLSNAVSASSGFSSFLAGAPHPIAMALTNKYYEMVGSQEKYRDWLESTVKPLWARSKVTVNTWFRQMMENRAFAVQPEPAPLERTEGAKRIRIDDSSNVRSTKIFTFPEALEELFTSTQQAEALYRFCMRMGLDTSNGLVRGLSSQTYTNTESYVFHSSRDTSSGNVHVRFTGKVFVQSEQNVVEIEDSYVYVEGLVFEEKKLVMRAQLPNRKKDHRFFVTDIQRGGKIYVSKIGGT